MASFLRRQPDEKDPLLDPEGAESACIDTLPEDSIARIEPHDRGCARELHPIAYMVNVSPRKRSGGVVTQAHIDYKGSRVEVTRALVLDVGCHYTRCKGCQQETGDHFQWVGAFIYWHFGIEASGQAARLFRPSKFLLPPVHFSWEQVVDTSTWSEELVLRLVCTASHQWLCELIVGFTVHAAIAEGSLNRVFQLVSCETSSPLRVRRQTLTFSQEYSVYKNGMLLMDTSKSFLNQEGMGYGLGVKWDDIISKPPRNFRYGSHWA
ncbi:hypothetical protein F5148DRAFT_1152318 [Russula earlei]|uniref:Uncharacterized protein n=1 Tax=Russula earlei TaxID=71964 RepID=A0ACC0TXM8_9AGAM|nr:hypothetical protein F5148DRAFT_1152318 [Russula earlei]